MAIEHITNNNKDLLEKTPKYVIKFFAEWCGPCKLLAPIVAKVAKEVDTPIFEIDVDAKDTKDIVDKYGIKSIPQMVYVKDGKEVGRKQGFLPEGQVVEFINSH